MPIYEYRCRACGTTIEQLRSATDADAPITCGCDHPDMVRLPSLIARTGPGDPLPSAGGGCCGGGACACG